MMLGGLGWTPHPHHGGHHGGGFAPMPYPVDISTRVPDTYVVNTPAKDYTPLIIGGFAGLGLLLLLTLRGH